MRFSSSVATVITLIMFNLVIIYDESSWIKLNLLPLPCLVLNTIFKLHQPNKLY